MLLVQGPGFKNHYSKPKSFCQLHSRTETKDCSSKFNHYKMITLEGMIPVYSTEVTNDQTTPKSHTTLKSGKILGALCLLLAQVLLGSILPSVSPSVFSLPKTSSQLTNTLNHPQTLIHFQMAVTSPLFTIKHVKV